MRALVFESQEALEVALRSGLVPVDTQRQAARVARKADGSIEIAPELPLTPAVEQRLLSAGVRWREASEALTPVRFWAQVIVPNHLAGDFEVPSTLMFAVPDSRGLIDFAGELLRLGCPRQELRAVSAAGLQALVRVKEAPFYAVTRALDREGGLRVFAPVAGSHERVWVELGYAHRVLESLAMKPEGLLLVSGTGEWVHLPDGDWLDIDALIDAAGVPPQQVGATGTLPRIPVTLRLGVGAEARPATLFVVDDGPRAVEALVRALPEAVLNSILFAVVGEQVLLRLRPGSTERAEALPGRPFAPVQELNGLFVPVGRTLEPPLRRERLRRWLAPDVDAVTWLEPTEHGFSPHSVAESAFQPLSAWVDYVIDGAAETLQAWVASAQFNFESIIGVESAPVASGAAGESAVAVTTRGPATTAPRRRAVEPSGPTRLDPVEDVEFDEVRPAPPSAPVLVAPEPTERSPSVVDAEIAREEQALLELDDAHEGPTRQQAWARLAQSYASVQRWREASLAWAQAVWAAEAPQVTMLAARWAGAMAVGLSLHDPPNRHEPERARGVVPLLLNAAQLNESLSLEAVAKWQKYLDVADVDLDVRSAWLARAALAKLAGGDSLGLARARDRVLMRLQRGLSLERDVPRLVTAAAHQQGGGVTSERNQRVVDQLEALLKAFAETPRKRSALEAPPHLTQAYVGFEFAWGFARLGLADRARGLVQQSTAALDTRNKVHAYLTRAYAERVTQAMEGASPETPLPQELAPMLAALQPFERYTVDRCRSYSVVLEPHERLSPFTGFTNAMKNRREELASLRVITDPAQLAGAIDERLSTASKQHLSMEERSRLLDGLCDLVPRLPEATAVPLLQRLVALSDDLAPAMRALVIEDALRVAGHFGKTALVRQLVGHMARVLAEAGSDGVREVSGTLLEGLRSLRRVGLRDEAAELLGRAAALLRGDDAEVLLGRLALAGGFAYLGDTRQSAPIIENALRFLSSESNTMMAMRLKLTLATARAIGNGPSDTALPQLMRLAQQLPWITDIFNMAEYCCISVVSFADALVLGHVGEDLTLKESTRRFLEEDEHAIRRRVHRDVTR